jgi:short-subunit dehydrogenase
MNNKKYAVVTGGSCGIGFDIACQLASRKYDLILIARSKKNLEISAKKISDKYDVCVHCFCVDLRNMESIQGLMADLEIFNENVEVLINNAGIGLGGEFGSEGIEAELSVIDLNIRALVVMTFFYVEKFKRKKGGYILNVSSLAGFQSGPYYGNYYASKSYVLSLTEAISVELRKHSVYCSVLCPGTTKTDFHIKAGTVDTGLSKGLFGVIDSSQRVAEIAVAGMFSGKRVIIPGLLNKLAAFSVRLVPRCLATAITSSINQRK